jgi:lipid-binding SYLF domain-containing protein
MTKRILNRFNGLWFMAAACIIALNAWLPSSALAASAKEIDTGVDESIVKFEKEVKNGKNFLDSSKGVLVFPRVLKGGAGFGGEYGEGALRVAGKSPYTPNIMPSVAKDADDRARSVLMVLHLPLTGMND